MNRSIRCPHGFDRDLVPCERCGDHDPCAAHEARNNAHRNPRKPVTNPRGRQPTSRRERLMYATRERRAGR